MTKHLDVGARKDETWPEKAKESLSSADEGHRPDAAQTVSAPVVELNVRFCSGCGIKGTSKVPVQFSVTLVRLHHSGRK